ncbi:MAG: transposase [Candidatus Methanomethylicaceae archaeon]
MKIICLEIGRPIVSDVITQLGTPYKVISIQRSIPVEVGVEETKTGKKSKHIVKGERKNIQVKSPKGNKAASIDPGINNMASALVSDGTWLLYKGVRAKEDYFYLQRMIAKVQSLADQIKSLGLHEAYLKLNREKSTGRRGDCLRSL